MTLDVLAIGAHPDDAEIGCGGTLARLASLGRAVGLVHLTSGEAGSRGTPEQRRREAVAAAGALGAAHVEHLDFGDGGLRAGREEEDALVHVLRRLRPRLVLAPAAADRHPDHERAHRLAVDAAFYAGLTKRGSTLGHGAASGPLQGEPHRPDAVWLYMLHHAFEPQVVVDVTEAWPAKQAALDAYESQIHRPDAQEPRDDGPQTLISSPDFRAALEGRARHYGLLVGATFGEPFVARRPLRADASCLLEGLA